MSRAHTAVVLTSLASRLVRRVVAATTETDRAEAVAACRRFVDGLPDAIRRLEAA